MPTNKKIQIAMLEMSPQNKAILEFYFDRAGNALYKVVNENQADALIIDYDQPSAKQHVADLLDDRQIPILLVSIKEQNLPSTVWLAKPLTASSLNVAAKSIHELIEEHIATAVSTAKNLADEADALVMNKQVEALAEKMEAKAAAQNEALETEAAAIATEVEAEIEVEIEVEVEAEVSDQDVLDVFGITEDNSFDETVIEENKEVETDNKQSSILGAGLAVAGTGALAATAKLHDVSNTVTNTVSNSINDTNIETNSFDLLESDDDTEDTFELNTNNETSLFDFSDNENNKQIAEDDLNIEANTNENQNADITDTIDEHDENEVDSLLDSLLEGDDSEVLNDVSEVEVSEVSTEDGLEDIFLESLEPDSELESDDELSSDLNEVSETDLFAELNNETTPEELISEDTISTRDVVIEVDKESVLLNEDFTLHGDIDSSTEGTYASTLEADFKDDEIIEKNSLEVVSNELEGLLVSPSSGFDESEGLTSNETKESLDNDLLNLDHVAEGEVSTSKGIVDLEYDFEGDATEDSLNESGIDLDTSVDGDLELSLLDETDNTDSAEGELEDLLKDISSSDDDGAHSEGDDASNEDTSTDEKPVLEGINDLDSLLQEIAPEIAVAAAVTGTADEVSSATNEETELEDDFSDIDLQSLLNEVREEAQKPVNTKGLGTNSELGNYDPTKAEKRWMQLCGNLDAIKSQKEVEGVSYDPSKHLLGVVLEQIIALKDKEHLYRIKYEDMYIVIDHDRNSIYCNTDVTDDEFSALCFNELDPEKLKIHDLDYSEERLYRSKTEKNSGKSHSMESFIWLMSLLTSRGRLPTDTNITKRIGLKAWPNLTRVESIPHAMHMAAVFSKHPGSLLDISGWLNIQQRYVFAFYNAALHLDMIELDSSKVKKPGKKLNKKGGSSGSEERGFFGRLLKRLKS